MHAISLAADTVKVDVAFYDEAEKTKLLSYPTAAAMEAIVETPLEIPQAEFLTYYLFHRIKLGAPGYRDYRSVGQKIHLWLSAIGECVDLDGSVRTPIGADQQLTEVSEHVGEAIGLAVINRVHGLTEADWAPIAEQRGRSAKPSFDFQIASDGRNFVQIETKGSSVSDNRVLSGAVKAQKRKIDEKKVKLFKLAQTGDDPNPASLRYGTITVLDGRGDGVVRCLLTDPPAEQSADDPKRAKLLSRMRRLRDWIAFLSPRAPLTAALATRVADLEHVRDWTALDGVPLLRGIGEPFQIEPFSAWNRRHSSFMSAKSRVTDGPAGGVVIQLSASSLFFIGIRERVLTLATRQNFGEITDFKTEVGSLLKTVECKFSKGRYRSLNLPPAVEAEVHESGGYVHFYLKGILHYSPEGLVFGLLPLAE